MCGRLNVIDDPLCGLLLDVLGIEFKTETNTDLRPTQKVDVIAKNGDIHQLSTRWGIKPAWSNKLLINAQAETVTEKRTFKKAFAQHRCLIPVSGWYEWRDDGGKKKQKYLFSTADNSLLLMAGIYYPTPEGNELVTLTIHPNEKCAEYHNRMPLLIPPKNIEYWFHSTTLELSPLIYPVSNSLVRVSKV